MLTRVLAVALAAVVLSPHAHAACPSPIPAAMQAVTHAVTTVNGLKVDRYAWYDSACLLRTVSLKQEGNGNPGHGGYIVQSTYQVAGTPSTTVVANAARTSDGGFGYFVSHERYRTFTDGSEDTIASRIFRKDDSPLGLNFAATGTVLPPVAGAAAHRFTINYAHYGTIQPIPKDADGNDVQPSPLAKSAYRNYVMPVTLTWVFQKQLDAPRLDVSVDLSQVPGPDLVNFDVRAPYGVLVFDNGLDGVVSKVMWGDRYHFATYSSPPTRDGSWTWSSRNAGGRYHALIASGYEMGLFEPRLFSKSALADAYADERGSLSSRYNQGHGCLYQDQLLPCDWEWPYQSIQYSLPYPSTNEPNANAEPTDFKKMAWGSSAYYGTGASLPVVWDTPSTTEPLNGWPASHRLDYSVCLLLGRTTSAGLTRTAARTPTTTCANVAF